MSKTFYEDINAKLHFDSIAGHLSALNLSVPAEEEEVKQLLLMMKIITNKIISYIEAGDKRHIKELMDFIGK